LRTDGVLLVLMVSYNDYQNYWGRNARAVKRNNGKMSCHLEMTGNQKA